MLLNENHLMQTCKTLAFEVQQFRCYVSMHRNGSLDGHPTAGQAVRYALLIHMRVLLDFFFGSTRDDGVGVRHFRRMLPEFAATFPKKIQTPSRTDVEDVRKNLHKRLAHITTFRFEVPTKPMDYYARHFDGLDALAVTFENALPHAFRTLFTDSIRTWKEGFPPKL